MRERRDKAASREEERIEDYHIKHTRGLQGGHRLRVVLFSGNQMGHFSERGGGGAVEQSWPKAQAPGRRFTQAARPPHCVTTCQLLPALTPTHTCTVVPDSVPVTGEKMSPIHRSTRTHGRTVSCARSNDVELSDVVMSRRAPRCYVLLYRTCCTDASTPLIMSSLSSPLMVIHQGTYTHR